MKRILIVSLICLFAFTSCAIVHTYDEKKQQQDSARLARIEKHLGIQEPNRPK